ncbi:MAG: signal peptidase [Actinomycetota bacterium]|nr:signal peptidase [Actinomycetota bacterium]
MRNARADSSVPHNSTGVTAPATGGLRALRVLLPVAAIVVALDQVTKQLAVTHLRDHPFDLIKGVLTLRLTLNSGGAFGILQGVPGLFLAATVLVIGLLIVWVRQLADPRMLVPLGMMLGGGLGNASDRLFRHFGGRVVDWIDLHVWPVFNLADSAIVIGVLLVIFMSSRKPAPHE